MTQDDLAGVLLLLALLCLFVGVGFNARVRLTRDGRRGYGWPRENEVRRAKAPPVAFAALCAGVAFLAASVLLRFF